MQRDAFRELSEAEVRADYRPELFYRTVRFGRVGASLATAMTLAYVLIDLFVLQEPAYVPWRFLSIIPSALYALILFFGGLRYSPRTHRVVYAMHLTVLTGWMANLCGVTIVADLNPVGLNGIIFVELGVFVMAIGGWRTALIPYVLTLVPFLVYVRFFMETDGTVWADVAQTVYVAIGAAAFAAVQERQYYRRFRADQRAQFERRKSDSLLEMVLPDPIIQQIKSSGEAPPRLFDSVTVMFTDFKGFTAAAAAMSPDELVRELDRCFSAFDRIIDKHNLCKIKTIGDSYMCAGGVPEPREGHAADCVAAGLEILDFMSEEAVRQSAAKKPHLEIRVGIHTGPVVAGIIGEQTFSYDVWGDAVNTASRMESSGEPGRINISEKTYEMVRDRFECELRGHIEVKGLGPMPMYFVTRRRLTTSKGPDSRSGSFSGSGPEL
ncbi:MAG: adenylate/guanylate cyclase domain-containing protein [Spirochaetales bacterium]|nr:adenylate/guanylate cyclase domain-containing protein [Leptospiraceae bacterium]MCP5481573.1 adenylate/guanylate cyclase domain-containing protein [Spirochaetales bacterium]MCP5484401.1 adenylate/guanylate cyclase domain-containing protein [Spirochaetales bacterium]